jgi:hypothetical protein
LDVAPAPDQRVPVAAPGSASPPGVFLIASAFLLAAGAVVTFSSTPAFLSFDVANGGWLPVNAIALGVFFTVVLVAVALVLEALLSDDAGLVRAGLRAAGALVVLGVGALTLAVLLALYGRYAHPDEPVVAWTAGPKLLTGLVLVVLALLGPLHVAAHGLGRSGDRSGPAHRSGTALGLALVVAGTVGYIVLSLATAPEWSVRILLIIVQVVAGVAAIAGYVLLVRSGTRRRLPLVAVVLVGAALVVIGLIAALAQSEQWQLLVAVLAGSAFLVGLVVEPWATALTRPRATGGATA